MATSQNRNYISVIIPVRDRELWRLKKSIKSIDCDNVGEIIVVDYNSEKPIKLTDKKIKVIKYNKNNVWDKAHAINIGIKKAKFDFICTIDVDIMADTEEFKKFVPEDNCYYTSSKVRRIDKKSLSSKFDEMWEKSSPWSTVINYKFEMQGLANGGLQIYPKKLIEDWNGIDENLTFSGGMDNITNLMARKSKLKIAQLPIRLLHIEHDKQKWNNFEEKELAFYLTSQRGEYLNNWIDNPTKNEFYGRLSGPCYPIFLEQKKTFDENKKNILSKIKEIENKYKKILITVINNNNNLPQRFVKSLIKMYLKTIQTYPNTEIKFVKACQVNHMRNISVVKAIEENADYLMQLDVDHKYDSDTIIKLMRHDKDFVCIPTRQRVSPFLPTQYYKLKNPIKQAGNYAILNKNDGLVKVEVSGPVAMLMKVEALKKLKFPYYWMDYSYGFRNTMGGDFVFCRTLKEKGFEIFVDSSINCPHFVKGEVSSHGRDAEIELDDGRM